MFRVRAWFAEVSAVVESAPELEYAIAAAFVLPTLIFAFGTYTVTGLDTFGPLGPLIVAIEEPFEILVAAISAIVFFWLFALVGERYRKARDHLYGCR